MPKKRERFERSDVPAPSAHRTRNSLIILAAVAVAVVVVVSVCWHLAQQNSNLNDRTLAKALTQQQERAAVPEGYQASEDSYTNVLVFTVDDHQAKKPVPHAVQLMSFNNTKGTAALINIALDTKVTTSQGDTTLSALAQSKGTLACTAPLGAACNISFDHIVVSEIDIWEQMSALKGKSASELMKSVPKLLAKTKTDMELEDLISLARLVKSAGAEGLSHVDAPASQAQLEDGTPVSVVDPVQLGLTTGTLVAAA